jgi:hypothetical protein
MDLDLKQGWTRPGGFCFFNTKSRRKNVSNSVYPIFKVICSSEYLTAELGTNNRKSERQSTANT